MSTSKVKPEDITQIKEEGNKAYKNENYYKAILFYEEGVRRCEDYYKNWKDNMPFRCEFGENPKLEVGCMYLQDFTRLKSVLFNNISTCYFHLNSIPKADQYNDMALMEDPDFAKALYRKCMILEKKGEFTNGHHIANFAIARFDSEFEEEENRKIVPKFVEMKERFKVKIPYETKTKTDNLEKEVEKELSEYNVSALDDLHFSLG